MSTRQLVMTIMVMTAVEALILLLLERWQIARFRAELAAVPETPHPQEGEAG